MIAMAVEGKVDEPFGELVADWKKSDRGGKRERLAFLCETLGLDTDDVDHVRYQLLHRTASAVIEAERFNAENALTLVHSFGDSRPEANDSFGDYCRFVSLFGKQAEMDSLNHVTDLRGVSLHVAWINGESKYLER